MDDESDRDALRWPEQVLVLRTRVGETPTKTCCFFQSMEDLTHVLAERAPSRRAVFTRPEVEVYTLRRKGDLEGT